MGSEQSAESAGEGAGMNAAYLMATAQAISQVQKHKAKTASGKKFHFDECFHPAIDLSEAQILVCPPSPGVAIPDGRFLLVAKPQDNMFSVAGSVTLLGGVRKNLFLVVSFQGNAKEFELIQENNKFSFNGHMTHCTSMTDLLTVWLPIYHVGALLHIFFLLLLFQVSHTYPSPSPYMLLTPPPFEYIFDSICKHPGKKLIG